MADVEYVARVIVERVVRRVVPKGTPTGRRSMTTSEETIMRDKAEVGSFTIRADSLPSIKSIVQGVMAAAFREGTEVVRGDPQPDVPDEEDEGLEEEE